MASQLVRRWENIISALRSAASASETTAQKHLARVGELLPSLASVTVPAFKKLVQKKVNCI
jgi:hypothetical protein